MALDVFNALQIVPTTAKVSAEMKTTIFYKLFAPSFSDYSFRTMPFKISLIQYGLAYLAITFY